MDRLKIFQSKKQNVIEFINPLPVTIAPEAMRVLRLVCEKHKPSFISGHTSAQSLIAKADSLLRAMGITCDNQLHAAMESIVVYWRNAELIRHNQKPTPTHIRSREHISALLANAEHTVVSENANWIDLLEGKLLSDEAFCERLRSKENFDVDFRIKGEPGLLFLAQQGYLKLFKLLLTKGAKVNVTTQFGNPLVVFLAENGYLAAAELLFQYGASPNVMVSERGIEISGNTVISTQSAQPALFYLISKGQHEALELFLKAGADIEVVHKTLKKPITHACFYTVYEEDGTPRSSLSEPILKCVELLLSYGAIPCPHWRDTDSSATTAHYAIWDPSGRLQSLLIRYHNQD